MLDSPHRWLLRCGCALLLANLVSPARAAQDLALSVSGANQNSDFGEAVAGVGDWNGDTVPDFAVGASRESFRGFESGAVFVYSGADGSLLFRFDGDAAGHRFGSSVAAAGDVNRDGVPDLIAGARRNNSVGLPTGYARVHSGADGAVLHTFQGTRPWDRFGHGATGVGDADQDGYGDLAVSAPHDDWQGPGSGSVRIYSGRTGAVLHLLFGRDPWDLFGWSLAPAGDLNLDGCADFLVGAPRADRGFPDQGAAQAYSGRTGVLLLEVRGEESYDALGYSVASCSDADGDGLPDLVVGAMEDFTSQTNQSGYAVLYSGAGGARLVRVDERSKTEAFGWAVAGLGDVNGDGFGDFVVGAPGAGLVGQSGLSAGAARVYSGISGRLVYEIDGDSTLDQLGHSVSFLGDLDQDGFDDLLVGEPGGNPNGNAWIYTTVPAPRLSFQNLVAGQTGTIRTEGGAPDTLVTFYYSVAGPGLTVLGSGLEVELAAPVQTVGSVVASAGGVASLSFLVAAPPGFRAWAQARQAAAVSPLSNLVEAVVQ